MIIELKETKKVPEVKVGDAVVTKCGDIVVICKNQSNLDYLRGFNLNRLEYTEFSMYMESLIECIEDHYGNIERVIESDKLKVVEV